MTSTVSQRKGIKYLWNIPPYDIHSISQLAATHNVSFALAQTLLSRGLTNSEEIRSFLLTSYEKDVGDPRMLKGMIPAVERLNRAIKNKEKILVFGDYDVDGITSSSMFMVSCLPLGALINFYLPHRERDGYGLSSKIVTRAAQNGYSLIVTVDNGTTAYQAAQTAAELGIDLIITDHHRPHGHELPPAFALVNPHQPECPYPYKNLAGVGVTFKLLSLLYEYYHKPLPGKVYELLLLGTVADVVPLVNENRFWVRHGLVQINQERSFALKVLARNANLTKERFTSLDVGFMLAPQLNALGRLDDPRQAVKFLISSQYDEVEKIGEILKTMNEERRRIERIIYDEIENTLTSKKINLDEEYIIMAGHHQWPAGVIGLVAGKLMHNYARPTILLHLDNNGYAKGSCRSLPAFNIFDALTDNKDLLLSFGGHACAAGLKLKQENIVKLKERLEEKIRVQVSPEQLRPSLCVDANLELPEMTKQLVDELIMLEPFGNQNPEPLFMLNNVQLQKEPQLLKDAHVKCAIFSHGIIKPVIFFNRPDLYQILGQLGEKPFSLVGHLTTNEWQGRTTIELRGADIAC